MTQAPTTGYSGGRLDALKLASAEDPYPAYAELRRTGLAHRGTFGEWLIPGHAEVAAFLRDPRLSSELPLDYARRALPDSPAVTFLERIMLTRDPPAHTQLRRALGHAFSEPVVRGLQAHVGELTDRVLAPGFDRGTVDVVEDVAVPLAVMVVCELLGVPADDRELVWRRVATLNKAFDAPKRTSDDVDTMTVALPWLRTYMTDLLADGRATPGGNPLSRMAGDQDAAAGCPATADADGLPVGAAPLGDDHFVDNVLFVLHAGVETSMGLISNGLVALLDHPDQLAVLRARPETVPVALDEFLRYDPPIQGTTRIAQQAIELGGQKIRAGRAVRLLLGSANRDELVFAEAERLDVTRQPNPHLGFGGGLHHCLGSALARLVSAAVFDRLVRCARLDLCGEPVRRQHASLRSYAVLPVAIRAS
jgi:cytochrome P450